LSAGACAINPSGGAIGVEIKNVALGAQAIETGGIPGGFTFREECHRAQRLIQVRPPSRRRPASMRAAHPFVRATSSSARLTIASTSAEVARTL
jgi:hypothetical protein